MNELLTWDILKIPLTQIGIVTGITELLKRQCAASGRCAVYVSLILSQALALTVTWFAVGHAGADIALGVLKGLAVWLGANGLFNRIQSATK